MSDKDEPVQRRVGPLDTLGQVRAEAARLYRRGLRGEMPAQDAGRLAGVLALVARLVEGGDFEARLAAVEAKLAEAARVAAEGRRCK
ncbi:MAG TPA: hypothetical protein VGE42_12805 [Candidatus Dormibacteraeota bacterium]